MNCPDCGGNCWDNRATKRNPKAPDYKCKNCGKGIWEKARNDAQQMGGNTGNGSPAPTNGQQTPHAVLYKHCVQYAIKEIKPLLSPDVCDADVLAAAATLFIQASRGGVVFPPKQSAQPAPPPPPPPPPTDYSDLPF